MTTARRGTTVARFTAAVVLGVLGAVPVSLVAAAVAPSTASAATYRYWTYWWGRPGTTSWQFASLGPASDVPGDGWVLGWRFGTTNTSGTGAKPPRTSHTYADLCGDPAVETGRIRVAVVVDYGSDADAPPGESPPGGGTARVECTSIRTGAHGFAAMTEVRLDLRVGDQGLVCGIDGYPRTECAAVVVASAASPTPTASTVPTATRSATPPRASSVPTTTASRSAASAARPSDPATSGSGTATTSAAGPPSSASAAAGTPSTLGSTASPAAPSATSAPSTTPTLPARSGTPLAASGTPTSTGGPLGFLGGAVLVAFVGAGAWWTTRRGAGRS